MMREPKSTVATCSDSERLTALLDGELDSAEQDEVYARVREDPELQQTWVAHHVVGDALRSSEVACHHSSQLCSRVSGALQAEPQLLARFAFHRRTRFQQWGAPIAGVAAASAFIVLGISKILSPEATSPLISTAAQPATSTPTDPAGALSSDSVAVRGPAVVELQRDPRIEDYLRAHREMDVGGVVPRAVRFLRAEDER